jgi:hypothetical protein
MDWVPFEEMQAYYRAWPVSLQTYPSVYSTNATGVGESGELWLFPQPGTTMEMELVTSCMPKDLYTNTDPDALPNPFRSAVSFYAAKLAFENTGMWSSAQAMEQEFNKQCVLACAASERGSVPSWYPSS